MPAPRAVLADIHDFNLDPTQKFGRTSSSGRLAHDGNGVTTTTTQGKPPVTTGSHFHFYGRTAPGPALVRLDEQVGPPAEEAAPEVVSVEEKSAAEALPDTDQATPAAKKSRPKKAASESQA